MRKRNAAKAAREERAERKAIREEAAPKLSQLAERVETLRGELRRLTLEGASASEILAAARALEKATRAHERARKRTPSLDELDTRPKRIKTALREMVEALEAHRRKEPGAYELFRDVKRRLHGERVANWAELCEEAAVEAGWSLGYAERFSKLS